MCTRTCSQQQAGNRLLTQLSLSRMYLFSLRAGVTQRGDEKGSRAYGRVCLSLWPNRPTTHSRNHLRNSSIPGPAFSATTWPTSRSLPHLISQGSGMCLPRSQWGEGAGRLGQSLGEWRRSPAQTASPPASRNGCKLLPTPRRRG